MMMAMEVERLHVLPTVQISIQHCAHIYSPFSLSPSSCQRVKPGERKKIDEKL